MKAFFHSKCYIFIFLLLYNVFALKYIFLKVLTFIFTIILSLKIPDLLLVAAKHYTARVLGIRRRTGLKVGFGTSHVEIAIQILSEFGSFIRAKNFGLIFEKIPVKANSSKLCLN